MSRQQWRVWAASAMRWLWAGAVVLVLVALLGVVRYVRDARQHVYLATQTEVVSVLPPSGGGSWTEAAADDAAQQVATSFGSSATLSSARALDAVAAQAQADQSLVRARFGASGAQAARGLDIHAPGAIAITHDGVRIAVTARAGSPAGAWLLATAAGQTLAQEAAQSQPAAAAGEQISVRALLDGAASPPALDPAPQARARLRLLETLLLGVAGGILLVAVASTWEVRSRVAAHAGEGAPHGAAAAAAGSEG